jgi:hypothetical protein
MAINIEYLNMNFRKQNHNKILQARVPQAFGNCETLCGRSAQAPDHSALKAFH